MPSPARICAKALAHAVASNLGSALALSRKVKGLKMKGVSMILFAVAFVLFVGAAFWAINTDNQRVKDACDKADTSAKSVDEMTKQMSVQMKSMELELRAIRETVLAQSTDNTKLKQKVEWLEMKANAQAQKLLEPSKPIQVSLVYRKAEPKKKADVITNIKKKLKELDH